METLKKTMRDSLLVRWSVLLLVSFAMAANYYVYDALTPLQERLREVLHFSGTDFGIVVGFYSFPNTFLLMAVLGGIILDRIGIRKTGFTFVLFMVIGAWITWYGASPAYNHGGFGYR
ncbi:MAG TPA: MFS transporter, partial [Bacteroidales bacterium]|nr:MFS transporter [Bacteroidales bacterium]